MSKVTSVGGLNDELFIPAIQVRSLAKLKVFSREERRRNKIQGDSLGFQELGGPVGYVHKEFVCRNYRFISGEKIRISRLKDGAVYTVHRPIRQNKKVIKLPKVEGNPFLDGKYIVCDETSDGGIDRDNYLKIDPQLFRKAYTIPQSDELINMEVKHAKIAEKRGNKKEEVKAESKAIAVKRNDKGKVAGFQIEMANGTRRVYSVKNTVDLIISGNNIVNLYLQDTGGKKVIKGRGIKINDLPTLK